MNTAIISLISAVVVALIGAITNVLISKSANDKLSALVEYRLKILEEKQDKHNSVIERTYKLEYQVSDIQKDLSEIKSELHR